ncbi:unnamed protein product [Closterium sp. NIES-54]
MAININFIVTSLLGRLAPVQDALLRKLPSALTINVLDAALKDVKRNIRSIASASGAVVPPHFQGCTDLQLPSFTASPALTASPSFDENAAVSTMGGWPRAREVRKGGRDGGIGGSGGGGGGAGGTSPSSGGGTGGGLGPAGPLGGGARAAAWYMAQ